MNRLAFDRSNGGEIFELHGETQLSLARPAILRENEDSIYVYT